MQEVGLIALLGTTVRRLRIVKVSVHWEAAIPAECFDDLSPAPALQVVSHNAYCIYSDNIMYVPIALIELLV